MPSRELSGHAVTLPLGGRDLHPYQNISCQGLDLASLPPAIAGGRENVSHPQKSVRRDTKLIKIAFVDELWCL